VYLDYLMHHLVNLALGFALGFGLAGRTGHLHWTLAGFGVAAGWSLLALHNDCRYKAFFQRLKSVSGSYRVEGGAGGKPAPPATWPRRGAGALTWPAYKLCEPHAVLALLTILAVLAIFSPGQWLTSWQAGVLGMGLLAPCLGVARVARALARCSVEAEFARWFQPHGGSIESSFPAFFRNDRCSMSLPGPEARPENGPHGGDSAS
jgi:hypothetical protein